MDDRVLTAYQFTLDAAIQEWLAQKKKRTGSHKTHQAYEETMRHDNETAAALRKSEVLYVY